VIYFGIDPGKKGGISALTEHAEVQLCIPMPVIGGKNKVEFDLGRIFSSIIRQGGNTRVYIERLAPMPPSLGGGAANYQRGFSMGMLQSFCTALKLPFELISPSVWQKSYWKGKTDTKQMSVLLAGRLFPTVELLPTERSRKPHDGMADSLLIAEYGRRHANGLLT
jgi:hypothetical protein